jgi:hypothetical protein
MPWGAYNSTTSSPVSARFFRFGSRVPAQNASAAEIIQRLWSSSSCTIALANARTATSTCALSGPDAFASAPDAGTSGRRNIVVSVLIASRSSCSFKAVGTPA